MTVNAKALSQTPVFGFEWSGCYSVDLDEKGEEEKCYINRNLLKAAGCLPIVNIVAGAIMIYAAVRGDLGDEKKAAFIARGIVTILGGGILFALADVVTTVGRALFRPEKEAKE